MAEIGASLDQMTLDIDNAKAAAGVITGPVVEALTRPVTEVRTFVGGIPATIDMPTITLPSGGVPLPVTFKKKAPHIELKPHTYPVSLPRAKIPDVTVPGVRAVKTGLAQIADIFDLFISVLQQIAPVGSLGKELTDIVDALRTLVTDLVAALRIPLLLLAGLVAALAGWLGLSYVLWARRRLRMGAAMIRGVPVSL